MGCLTYKLTRIGGIDATLTWFGGISVPFVRKGGMACRMGLVCKPNIAKPYLEINPEIIWVYPDWSAYNEVYSNTHWNVD